MIWGYHFRNPPSLLSPVKSQMKSRTAVTVGFQPRWCVVFYRAQQPEQHPGPLCLTDLSWQGQSLNGYTAEKWAKRGQARIGNLVSTGCIGAKDEMTRAAFLKAKSLRRFVAFVAHVGLGKSCWCQLTTRSWDLFAGKPTYFAYRNRNMSLTQRRVCFFCCLLQRLKSSPPDSWRSVSLKRPSTTSNLVGTDSCRIMALQLLHQISMAAIVSSSRQVIKDSFTCCKPRMGPELRYLPT